MNGVEGRFILETGASYTSIFRQSVTRFHLKPTKRVTKAMTANGTVQVAVAYGTVQVRQQQQQNAAILILPMSESDEVNGLLGSDFMKRFNGEIDLRRHRFCEIGLNAPTPLSSYAPFGFTLLTSPLLQVY